MISERIGVDTYNQTLSDTSIPVRVGNAKDSLPAVLAAPPVCGTLSDGAHRGGGLTDRTPTRAESCPSVARTLTQRMHKGFDSTLDSQTPIVTHGGVFDGEPTCFHPTEDPICSSDGSAHAMGTGSKGGCSTHAIAETQYGSVCGSLTARHDSSPCADRGQNVVAIQERAVCENPNAGTDGAGVRDDGVSYTLESRTVSQAVAFKPGQGSSSRSLGEGDEVCCTLEGAANGNAGHKVAIQQAMQVRRLCPSECEALQGFPIGYTDVTYRKKPACDGPRYRALGNSMAVPCMWWLGYRIQKATA